MNTLLEELHDGLKQSNPTQKLQNRMDDILEGMYRAAQWQILELLPGSSTRNNSRRIIAIAPRNAPRLPWINTQNGARA